MLCVRSICEGSVESDRCVNRSCSNSAPCAAVFAIRLSLAALIGIGAVLGFVLSGTARATPLDPSVVHPDAPWVVHLNLEEVRQAGNTQEYLTHTAEWLWSGAVGRARADLGISFSQDVLGVTLYAQPGRVDSSIAVLTTSDAAEGIFTNIGLLYPLAMRERRTPHGVRYVSWKSGDLRLHVAVLPGRAPGQRLVIIADRRVLLETGAAVASGARAPTQLSQPLDFSRNPAGSVFFAATTDLRTSASFKPTSRMFKLMKGVESYVIFTGDRFATELTFAAENEANAAMLETILVAVFAYWGGADPSRRVPGSLLRQARIERIATTVRVRMNHSQRELDDVFAMMSLRESRTRAWAPAPRIVGGVP
jgi:hypothetical protein